MGLLGQSQSFGPSQPLPRAAARAPGGRKPAPTGAVSHEEEAGALLDGSILRPAGSSDLSCFRISTRIALDASCVSQPMCKLITMQDAGAASPGLQRAWDEPQAGQGCRSTGPSTQGTPTANLEPSEVVSKTLLTGLHPFPSYI